MRALSGLLALSLGFARGQLQIHYYSDTFQSLEANALEVSPFHYAEVWASDAHNGDVDICERLWYFDGGDLELCCTSASRSSVINGCPSFAYADQPEICGYSNEDSVCNGVTTSSVATYYVQYTAMDYSENTASPVDVTIELIDTTPPEIPVPEDCGGDGDYVYEVEKCTYYDIPELEALDAVNLYLETEVTISFFDLGHENVIFGNDGGTRSLESEVYCVGGLTSDDVAVNEPGVYCIQYDAVDYSQNVATPETIVVYVEDTTPPSVLMEIPETTIECAVEDGIPDPIATATNLPCLDYPAATLSYILTDHPHLCTANDGDCEDVAMVTQSEGSYTIPYVAFDGYNSATGWQTVETVDTTDPLITCPNDVQLRVHEEFYEGDAIATDTCTDPSVVDNREVVDESTIGVYTVTFTATDEAGNDASCDQEVELIDVYAPTCNVNGDEYITIEACTGTYVELGATAQDNYDTAIQSKMTTTGVASIDINTPGTYEVEYNVCDQTNLCADTCVRIIEVADTVPPVVTTNGELIMAEASVFDIDASADATDACGVDNIDWTSEAITFERCENFGFEVSSEYWVNVYGDSANEFVYYCGATVTDADTASATAKSAGDINQLAAACAAYEIVYTAVDVNGNSGSATQDVWVIDTEDPTIYATSYFAIVGAAAATSSGSALLVAAAVMAVAGVSVKAAASRRQRAYMPI